MSTGIYTSTQSIIIISMTEIELCCRLRSLKKAIEKREGATIEMRRKKQLARKDESFRTKRLGRLSYPHLC